MMIAAAAANMLKLMRHTTVDVVLSFLMLLVLVHESLPHPLSRAISDCEPNHRCRCGKHGHGNSQSQHRQCYAFIPDVIPDVPDVHESLLSIAGRRRGTRRGRDDALARRELGLRSISQHFQRQKRQVFRFCILQPFGRKAGRTGPTLDASRQTRHPPAFGCVSEKLVSLKRVTRVHGEGPIQQISPSLIQQPRPLRGGSSLKYDKPS